QKGYGHFRPLFPSNLNGMATDLIFSPQTRKAQRFVLLHEANVGDRGRLGDLAYGAELLLVSPDILLESAQDSLGVPRTYDHARNQLALRHIRKQKNEMNREFFRRMVKHYQVRKLPDEFLFICLDLNLHLLARRLSHWFLRSR